MNPRPVTDSLERSAAPSRRWLALAVLALAQFMLFLDETIVNVALPSIKDGLGFSQAGLAWVIDAYILLFGGFLLLGGRAADIFGRRRMFLVGTAVFGLASLLVGLAQSQQLFIGARALQGIGAALATPAALALVTTLFTEEKERAKALGVWGGLAGLGFASGVLLGGLITDLFEWRWVFLINVPVALLVLVAVPRIVEPSSNPAPLRPPRRRSHHRRADNLRLRHPGDRLQRLALSQDDRTAFSRNGSPRRVRSGRTTELRTARSRPARQETDDHRRERDPVRGRRVADLKLLPAHALPAAGARILTASGRTRLHPAGGDVCPRHGLGRQARATARRSPLIAAGS